MLAGRVIGAKGIELTGRLIVNNQPRDDSSFKARAAYVMQVHSKQSTLLLQRLNPTSISSSPLGHSQSSQDDILYAFLTVYETLLMATHFQMGFVLSQKEKNEYVNSIVSVLGLVRAKNTIIGDAKVSTRHRSWYHC